MTEKNREAFLIHFGLYLLGAIGLLWFIYLTINAMRFNWAHTSQTYWIATLLVLGSTIFEIITRPANRLFLGSLSNRQLSEISQRQTLYTLVFIFGYMVISRDNGLSRSILGVYSIFLFMWTLWMNRFGFRMLVRSLHTTQKRREQSLSKSLFSKTSGKVIRK